MTETWSSTSRKRLSGQAGNDLCRLASFVLIILAITSSGCVSIPWNPWRQVVDKKSATDSGKAMVLGTDGGVIPASANQVSSNGDLEEGLDLYRQGKFHEAQKKFHSVSRNKKSTPREAEKALYHEAECLRQRKYLKSASEVYSQQLKEYPRHEHSQMAMQRMFDIAEYWLEETRAEMKASAEKKAGKRSMVWPVAFVHFDKTKPILDIEGRAVALLEKIYLNDIDGVLGEKALFYLGGINFYRENYREADHYFSQIVKFHPNGKYASKSLEMTIICKQMSTGGSEYDGRILAEARKLVHLAQEAYPELAHDKTEFLERQIFSINMQQADGDFKIAEYYRRVGRPGSAYFYYEVVRRRYPGTKYARDAEARMREIKNRVDQQEKSGGSGGMEGFLNWMKQPFSPRPETANQGKMPGDNSSSPNTGEGSPKAGAPEQLPTPRPYPGTGGNPQQLPQPRILPGPSGAQQLPPPRTLGQQGYLPELGQGGGYGQ